MQNIDEIFTQINEDRKHMDFISTGWRFVDEAIDGGFLRKELIVIGAQTGTGKSIFGGHLFWEAVKQKLNCAYFSLEISNQLIASRIVGQLANIPPIHILTGTVWEEKIPVMYEKQAELSLERDHMSFYDNLYKLDEITSEIKKNKYEFVVVDFLQNIIQPSVSEYEKLSQVALELQKVAKEVNCCIVCLSQLSNAINKMGEKRDLEYKGSGSIATACDMGFFISRLDGMNDMNKLFLRKNRRGAANKTFMIRYMQPGGSLFNEKYTES